jgi:hypothetical protein
MKYIISSLTLLLLLLSPLCYSQKPVTGHSPSSSKGDTITVTHSAGICDGNVYVTVEDPAQLTGHDYKVSFHTQAQIRDPNGNWIPGGAIIRNINPDDPDTLTGTTIDIAAVYGPNINTIDLLFHLEVVHHYYGWADGVTLTFPVGIQIVEVPCVVVGGTAPGDCEPVEILGNVVKIGVTNNSHTQGGHFHDGGEDWIVRIDPSTFTLPLSVDWEVHDDGYAGGMNELGTTTVYEVGYASRLAKLWNLLDVTTGELTLEDISIVNGIDLFPRRDDDPTIVPNPIVDGFQINVDITYDPPIEFSSIELYSPSGLSILSTTIGATNEFIRITNYTVFSTVSSKAIDNFGVGTNEVSELQQDYELRFTGVLDTMTLPDGRTYIYVSEGGSMATIFRIQGGDFTVHPSNTTGVNAPFLLRIPFEVWNVDDPANEYQVNLTFRDRIQQHGPGGDDPLYSWNLVNRMYSILVNSSYDPTQVIQVDGGPDPFNDPATWVLVHWGTNYHLDDVVNIFYRGPVQFGIDEFTFTTPDPYVSVEDELIVTTYELSQNYPNPFNPNTKITYTIPEFGFVTLKVYDVLGSEVATFVNEEKPVGSYEVEWEARGSPSGVYFYQLTTGSFIETNKMILLK